MFGGLGGGLSFGGTTIGGNMNSQCHNASWGLLGNFAGWYFKFPFFFSSLDWQSGNLGSNFLFLRLGVWYCRGIGLSFCLCSCLHIIGICCQLVVVILQYLPYVT